MTTSVTKTVQKPRVQTVRKHDYLYDADYTLSSARDHARDTFKAHTGMESVKRVPNFTTMFSDLRHYPRQSFQLDRTDPVPPWVNRGWRGFQDQLKSTMERYTKFNYAPDVVLPPQKYEDPQVSGVNRYKYFRRPIIPFLQQLPPSVVLQQPPPVSADFVPMPETHRAEPRTRTVGVQTMYRENETQTDPYSPEYVIRPGSQPELLTLATLSYGHGLPAGLAEVEMIERARAKRAWEATLPPLDDADMHEKRRRMMDEQETREWAFREEEIERIQEARLKLLEHMLSEREKEHDQLNTKRLEHLWHQKQQNKELRVKKIRTKHIQALRKLTKQRENVEGKLQRRDVINDYANFASQTYAPLTRIGVFMDRNSEQYTVRSRLLSTYDGLLELEASLPDFIANPRVKCPIRGPAVGGIAKRKERRSRQLDEVDETIRIRKAKAAESPKPLRLLEKVEKPIPRPATPTQPVPSIQQEEEELAVILLQQLIRGRAVQNKMFEGKERRLELIRELRSTHALQAAGQKEKEEMRRMTLAAQDAKTLEKTKEAAVEKVIQDMTGGQVGQLLDYLSKELILLQEERRIAAFVKLAERERRLREAEESGLRQVEERKRREEDEIFRQLVKIHQTTVDTYLEDLILNSADKTADEQAREEIRKKAETINRVAHDLEHQRTKLQSEEMVSQLVHTFLLPEVEKQTTRERLKHEQRKHIVAAHKIIHKKGEEVIGAYQVPRPPSRATSVTLSSSTSSVAQTGTLHEREVKPQ